MATRHWRRSCPPRLSRLPLGAAGPGSRSGLRLQRRRPAREPVRGGAGAARYPSAGCCGWPSGESPPRPFRSPELGGCGESPGRAARRAGLGAAAAGRGGREGGAFGAATGRSGAEPARGTCPAAAVSRSASRQPALPPRVRSLAGRGDDRRASPGTPGWAMKGPLLPVGRDRRISDFPKCYTPEACLQLREDFHAQVRAACQRRSLGSVSLKISKAVVVGDLCVGKTSLINRFCKEAFDRDYKATIGVDFEIERFEIAGVPYNLQIWDTAGQEKFKCIASAYYRGAEVIITVFDLADIQTLDHTKRWLEEALQENRPGSSFVFLVGTKKDLLSNAESERTERDAVRLANEMQAEYWSVSAKTGENVKDFFFRVAALAFERSVLMELEKSCNRPVPIGTGDFIRIEENVASSHGSRPSNLNCC